jgi:hypothetical protein
MGTQLVTGIWLLDVKPFYEAVVVKHPFRQMSHPVGQVAAPSAPVFLALGSTATAAVRLESC